MGPTAELLAVSTVTLRRWADGGSVWISLKTTEVGVYPA
jgi:hypothetical protein